MSSWKIFDKLTWNIYQPLSNVKIFKSGSDELLPTREFLSRKVPVKKGDRVVILTHSCGGRNSKMMPVLTEPVRGSTVRDVLHALHKGLNKKLVSGNRGRNGSKRGDYYFHKDQSRGSGFPTKNIVVYSKISSFFDRNLRIRLINKYESGQLKPYELYGDHRYFEGIKRKGKLLYFAVGS